MSDLSFFQSSTTQDFARNVANKTGMPMSVLLAQMAIETSYGTSPLWTGCFNPAGIKWLNGTFACYGTLAAGADAYANFYLDNSNYAHVLAEARLGSSPIQVAYALGQSQWDTSGHYSYGGVEGGLLVNVIQNFNLTQYDRIQTSRTDPAGTHRTVTPGGLGAGAGAGNGTGGSSSAARPNCSNYGTYVGEGTAAGIHAGFYLFAETVNGVKINSVVDQSCQLVAQYTHGTPKTGTPSTGTGTVSTITKTIISTAKSPINYAIIAVGLGLGLGGLYYLERQHGVKLFRGR